MRKLLFLMLAALAASPILLHDYMCPYVGSAAYYHERWQQAAATSRAHLERSDSLNVALSVQRLVASFDRAADRDRYMFTIRSLQRHVDAAHKEIRNLRATNDTVTVFLPMENVEEWGW